MKRKALQVGPMPPALVELLAEADRLLKKIEARTARPARPTGGVKTFVEVLYESIALVQNYSDRVEGLRYQIEDINFVLYGVPEEKPDIAGAVARIEEHVDDLLLQRPQNPALAHGSAGAGRPRPAGGHVRSRPGGSADTPATHRGYAR